MKHFRIKKVITKKSQILYYKGDGIWYGRVSKSVAEQGLANGQYILEETVDKRIENHPISHFCN